MSNITYVTGLWDIKRSELDNDKYNWNRTFDNYINTLKNLLLTNLNFIVFGDINIENIVKEYPNAKFIYYDTSKFYTSFPYYKQVNYIRLNDEWFNQPNAEWLKSSPQAKLELFNPVVLSKMYFIKKACELNYYNSNRFYWIDAGITRTNNKSVFNTLESKLLKYNKFLFFNSTYLINTEIHGLQRKHMNKYCNTDFINYVSKAQFFGGPLLAIDNIINIYYDILNKTLNNCHLGTEESIFTIMTHIAPELYDLILMQTDSTSALICL